MDKNKETVRLILLNQNEIMRALISISNDRHPSTEALLRMAITKTAQHVGEYYSGS